MNAKDKQIIIDLAKSLHKAVYKALAVKKPKDIVDDVLDGNRKLEIDPEKIPARRTGVMYKSDEFASKLAKFLVEKYFANKR